MKIISVITEKGGVGKTTTVIHLEATLSEMGNKVLLIDFDPQINLSDGYKISEEYSIKGINKLFPSIQRIIDEYNENLDFSVVF